MACIENFSWVATEWNMHKDTVADASLEKMCEDAQFSAYVHRCMDKFNEVTRYLSTFSIRTSQELQECINIIQYLNNRGGSHFSDSMVRLKIIPERKGFSDDETKELHSKF